MENDNRGRAAVLRPPAVAPHRRLRRVGVVRLLAVLLTVSLSACKFHYTWDARGPFETSGAIREVIIDPANPNRLYAAAENGGVWVLDDVQSPNDGWRPLSDQLENLQMRGIAKSTVDSSYIVAGNALGLLYHTEDHGTTWTRISDDNYQYIRRLLISEGLTRVQAGNFTRLAKETRILVACRNGLFRVHLTNHAFQRIDTLFPRNTTQGTDVLDVVRHPTNPAVLYVGVRGTGVFRSGDDGDSWQPSASWATFEDTRVPMIKLAINRSRVVAKMGRNVIVNDAGGAVAGWRQLPAVPWAADDDGGSDIGYRGNYSGMRGEWSHAIAIHPTDTATIVVGQIGLFSTKDGGATWSSVNSGHEDIQSLVFSRSGNRLFLSNDGGVFSSLLNGTNATALTARLATMQFYRVGLNGNVAVGNADHQGIHGTTNVGAMNVRWTRATPFGNGFGNNGLENDFVFPDAANAGRFFIAFQSQFLLRLRFPSVNAEQDLLPMDPPATPLQPFTTRGGNNAAMNQLNQLNYAVGTLAIDPRPGANVILTAAHQDLNRRFTIQLTRNGNADPTGAPPDQCGDDNNRTFCFPTPVANTAVWTTSFGPIATPIVSIAFSPTQARKVYALDESGVVRVKDDIDDANAWRQVGSFPVGANNFARQILPSVTTVGTVYALTHRAFMVSTDTGATWTQRGQATLPATKFNAIASHPTRSRVLYLGTDSDVLVSGNGGTSWESIGGSLPNAPVMQLFTDGTYLYAVTFGRGLWRAALPK
jgi:photosystem II stability/assembly factor-like uncharacterized protein